MYESAQLNIARTYEEFYFQVKVKCVRPVRCFTTILIVFQYLILNVTLAPMQNQKFHRIQIYVAEQNEGEGGHLFEHCY